MTDNTNQQQGAGGRPQDVLRRDGGIARQLVLGAVVVGLILIAAGIALFWKNDLPIALPALVICVGFGLVLSAFGSRAGGTIAGFAVVGSAALAVVLFVVLQYYLPDEELAYVKYGNIGVEWDKIADIRIVDDDPLFTARDEDTGLIKFIILDPDLKSTDLRIRVDPAPTVSGGRLFEMKCDSATVEKRYLSDQSGVIDWQLVYSLHTIQERSDVICSEQRFFEPPTRESRDADRTSFRLSLIGRALASDPAPPDTDQIADNLIAGDTWTRRNTRDQIAGGSEDWVPVLMEIYAKGRDVYNIKLGILVGLSDMLKRKDIDPAKAASYLTDQDIAWLVDAVYDTDPTIRVSAADVLFELADARIADASLDAIAKSESPDGIYNNVLVLSAIYPTLPPDMQEKLYAELKATVPTDNRRTWGVIDSFEN